MNVDITIIGAGAAGMIAGITIARCKPSCSVVLLERMDRPGKKLLATGNGRCNYTNIAADIPNYHGRDPVFVRDALDRFSVEDAISFFKEIGVFPRIEDEGKVYPYSGNASAVLDALRFELDRLGIPVVTRFSATGLQKSGQGFIVTGSNADKINTQKVILTAGGKASPSLGSDGSGYRLLTELGHRLTNLSPALTQIKTEGPDVKPLQGIKFTGNASAVYNGKFASTLYGEVLFTSFGLSGPPVFQLSCIVAEKRCDEISLDLVPDIEDAQLFDLLAERNQRLSHLTIENYFSGLINKRIGNLIARRAGIEKLSTSVTDLRENTTRQIAKLLKDLRFRVTGLNGWDNAQVTAGGIVTDVFDPKTLESHLAPGLYAAGEILDIFGDCGGYNLQWAWSSGYTAGLSAAESL